MKAAVLEQPNTPLVLTTVPDPTISSQEVLIEVSACGVCHTDLHIREGLFQQMGIDVFPIIMGHEITGVIREVGQDVSHLRAGDRVGVYFPYTCRSCGACVAGVEQACATIYNGTLVAAGMSVNGGYAELVKAPASAVLKLPEALDLISAAPLFCGGLTAYGALKNAEVRANHRVAILGIGGLGHLAIPIARAMGAEVIAITGSTDKVALAERLGAHSVIVAKDQVGARLLEAGGADAIISTSVDAAGIGEVMQGLRPRGTFVLTGLTTEPVSVTPAAFAFAQQRIIGSLIGSRSDMTELLDLAVRHHITPQVEVHSLAEVNDVHARLTRNEVRMRAVLKM